MTTQRELELEAEIVRLREALTDITDVFSTIGITAGIYDDELAALEKAAKTLLTPFTPTALNELVEKVEKRTIERCAREAVKRQATVSNGNGLSYRSWDDVSVSASHIESSIRSLPVGQIKLEELL